MNCHSNFLYCTLFLPKLEFCEWSEIGISAATTANTTSRFIPFLNLLKKCSQKRRKMQPRRFVNSTNGSCSFLVPFLPGTVWLFVRIPQPFGEGKIDFSFFGIDTNDLQMDRVAKAILFAGASTNKSVLLLVVPVVIVLEIPDVNHPFNQKVVDLNI